MLDSHINDLGALFDGDRTFSRQQQSLGRLPLTTEEITERGARRSEAEQRRQGQMASSSIRPYRCGVEDFGRIAGAQGATCHPSCSL